MNRYFELSAAFNVQSYVLMKIRMFPGHLGESYCPTLVYAIMLH